MDDNDRRVLAKVGPIAEIARNIVGGDSPMCSFGCVVPVPITRFDEYVRVFRDMNVLDVLKLVISHENQSDVDAIFSAAHMMLHNIVCLCSYGEYKVLKLSELNDYLQSLREDLDEYDSLIYEAMRDGQRKNKRDSEL